MLCWPEVDARACAILAKEQDTQKTTFERKSKNALGGQGAKYIVNVARVSGPVGAKFKFHNNSGSDFDTKSQGKNLGSKGRHVFVDLFSCAQVHPLHDEYEQPQADAERRLDVMESNGEGKLYTG